MLEVLGIILILIGVLGLFGLVPTGLTAEIILIVVGILLIAYERGLLTRRRR